MADLADVPGPDADTLARARRLVEAISGAAFPAAWSDTDTLLVGTGRRVPDAAERADLGPLAERIPLVLG